MTNKSSILKKAASTLLAAAVWIGIWWLLSLKTGNEVLLPSPVSTVKTLFSLTVTGKFWLSCLYSFIRVATGIVAGTAAGLILAFAGAGAKIIKVVFSPILSVIRATPAASFIILALVWIGRGNVPAFTSFLMVMPVIFNSVTTAIEGTDRQLVEMTGVFRFSAAKKLKCLYIPSVMPSFFSGVTTSLGLAWKAGIAAEVICNPEHGIGAALYDSKVYLETPELFAWTSAVIIISMLSEKAVKLITAEVKKRNGDEK